MVNSKMQPMIITCDCCEHSIYKLTLLETQISMKNVKHAGIKFYYFVINNKNNKDRTCVITLF